MGICCALRQISPAHAQYLLREPGQIFEYLADPSSLGMASEALDLDKAWHAMHYLLTGQAAGGDEPWCYLLEGGTPVGGEEYAVDFGPVRILLPPQVLAFSEILATISPAVVAARFRPAELETQRIYPGNWTQDSEGLEEWLNGMFDDLRNFLHQARARRQAVLIHIS